MDPITAVFNAIAAFFHYAESGEGQKMMADFRALDQQLGAKLKDLFDKIHAQATAK